MRYLSFKADYGIIFRRGGVYIKSKRIFTIINYLVAHSLDSDGDMFDVSRDFAEAYLFEIDFQVCVVDVDSDDVAVGVKISNYAFRYFPAFNAGFGGQIDIKGIGLFVLIKFHHSSWENGDGICYSYSIPTGTNFAKAKLARVPPYGNGGRDKAWPSNFKIFVTRNS